MKKGRVGMMAVLIAGALAIVWAASLLAETNLQKQTALIEQAQALLADEIYIRAQPLLEEAVSYQTPQTTQAEDLLRQVYSELREEQGYARKYLNLLEKQMEDDDAEPELFFEAADYYKEAGKTAAAIAALRKGAEKTNDPALLEAYENDRYQYRSGRVSFAEIMEDYNGMRQVQSEEGLWGLSDLAGKLSIPCSYEKISTYSSEMAVARSADEKAIFSLDAQNHRLYVLHEPAEDFGNYANGRLGLKTGDGWHRATGDFTIGTMCFEALGMYTDGYVAAKSGGRWGVIDLEDTWLLPAEFDAIKMDELGRCIGQKAVFAEKGGVVTLFVGGEAVPGSYEDAYPFCEDGYAAVKQNGKWGFVDTTGAIRIACQFDDARSFHQGLAAVKLGEKWGYINLDGKIAIEPIFYHAKSFSGGYAPVETENGWTIIQLYEYES